VRRGAAAVLAVVAIGVAATLAARDPSPAPPVRVTELASGLAQPVQVVAAPDGRPLVVEQQGVVRWLDPPRDVFLDLRGLVRFDGEQGLLGLAFHPGAPADPRLYVHYSGRNGETRVVEYRDGADGPQPVRTLLVVPQPHPNHNGGNLVFDADGLLYVGLGDGGGAFDADDRSQDPATPLGKVLRLDVRRDDIDWDAVAVGARNPWRLSIDPATDDLWIADVGQDLEEEVDRLPAGLAVPVNLGWPRREGHRLHPARTMLAGLPYVGPELVYGRGRGCSVVGGPVLRDGRGHLDDRYVYGDLCSGRIWSVAVDGDGPAGDPRAEDALVPGLVSLDGLPDGRLLATSLYGYVYALET
jgi:glucose/arabinose dehydrogenase